MVKQNKTKCQKSLDEAFRLLIILALAMSPAQPVKSKMPVSMENLPINNGSGQSFGFILYETSVCTAGHLYVHVEDTAQVCISELL